MFRKIIESFSDPKDSPYKSSVKYQLKDEEGNAVDPDLLFKGGVSLDFDAYRNIPSQPPVVVMPV